MPLTPGHRASFWFGQPMFHPACDDLGQADKDASHHQVKGQVKQHHQSRRLVHPGSHIVQPQTDERCRQCNANDFEHQIAQG